MGKTTHDEIDIDLDGTIDAAIRKLQKLKKEYPKGRISLETEYSYGDSYPRLRLHFSRDKSPVELEYDKWREKLEEIGRLRSAARAYEGEGDEYPRQADIAKLKNELGAWAESNRMGHLIIMDGEVLMDEPLRGAFTRDGEFRFRYLGFQDYEKVLAEVVPPEAA